MPVQIACPSCSRQLKVPDNLVGQMVKCPGCQKSFRADVESGPAPEPPREEPREEPRPSRRREEDEGYREEEPRPSRRPARRDDYDDDDDGDRGPRRRRRSENLAPHRGNLIMILGILSLFVGGIFIGLPAWIMGNKDLKEMRAGRMDPSGESSTNVGRICGMITTILTAVSLLVCCPIYIILIIGAGAGGR